MLFKRDTISSSAFELSELATRGSFHNPKTRGGCLRPGRCSVLCISMNNQVIGAASNAQKDAPRGAKHLIRASYEQPFCGKGGELFSLDGPWGYV